MTEYTKTEPPHRYLALIQRIHAYGLQVEFLGHEVVLGRGSANPTIRIWNPRTSKGFTVYGLAKLQIVLNTLECAP